MTASAELAPPAASDVDDQERDELQDRLPDDGLFELVHGRLTEKRMGWEANWVAGQVAFFLNLHLQSNQAGEVIPEQSFACFPNDPGGYRRPDVAFVAAARVPTPLPTGNIAIAPDLAVEVVSPNDVAYELEAKLADYRSAGVRLVWFLFPPVRTVRVYPLGGPPAELTAADALTGGDVLPGFSVPVAALFRRPATA